MRCFFAVSLNDELKNYLYDLMNQLKKELKKYNLKIRFIPKKNLHITLLFLGEIDETKLEKIKEEVRKIKFNSFKFRLNTVGFFPNEDSVRVIWVGVKPEKDAITLQKKIDESILGISKYDARFKVHITLARVSPSKQSNKLIPSLNKIEIKKLEQKIDSFELYKSEL